MNLVKVMGTRSRMAFCLSDRRSNIETISRSLDFNLENILVFNNLKNLKRKLSEDTQVEDSKQDITYRAEAPCQKKNDKNE